jgi:hypothetical protein
MTNVEQVPASIEINFFILADRAEAVNGKMYMLGGGWDRITVPGPGIATLFSFAIGLLIPFEFADEEVAIEITVENLTDPHGPKRVVQANLSAHLPQGIGPGDTASVLVAIPIVPIAFTGPGKRRATLHIARGPSKSADFRVFMPDQAVSEESVLTENLT